MSVPEFDPKPALRILVEHEVSFVLIGGLAANAWGSPTITHDLDICYGRSRDNLERLAQALRSINARLRGAPEDVPFLLDAETLARGDSFTFVTDVGSVDILGIPSGSEGFSALVENAQEVRLWGIDLHVASLDDLIRMKLAAGRPKDLRMAEELGGLRDELEGQPEEEYRPPGAEG